MRRGKGRLAILAATLGLMALWAPSALAAAPGNDAFVNREALVGPLPVQTSGSNVGATKEAGEPGTSIPFGTEPAGHSVWYAWTAASAEWVSVDTCGSDFDTMLDVYEGSLPGPQSVADWKEGPRTDCASGGEQVTFLAQSGTEYAIRVDGDLSPMPPAATEGAIALRLAPTPVPANDDFAAAQAVVAERLEDGAFYRVDIPGFNWNATKEAGEPAHAGDPGGASVWYSWTAPASGKANAVVVSGAFSSQLGFEDLGLLGVYAGSSLTGLAPVGAPGFSRQQVKFDAVAGTTYRIAVDGSFDSGQGRATMGGFDFLIYLEVPTVAPPVTAVYQPGPAPTADGIAPNTTIFKRSIRAGKRSATLSFRSSEKPGGFLCKLDSHRKADCASPSTYRGLAPGSHTFKVWAVDRAGNADPTPATTRFTIAASQRAHR